MKREMRNVKVKGMLIVLLGFAPLIELSTSSTAFAVQTLTGLETFINSLQKLIS